MTSHFSKDRWLCTYEELRDSLITHVKERGIFDVESFFSVSDYLVRGKVTQHHHDYVFELAQGMNLAGASDRNDSIASRIIQYSLRNATLFSNASTPYVRINIDGHFEIWPVKSEGFKRHISRELYEIEGITLNDSTFNTASTVIEGKAIHEGLRITLHNRVTWYEEDIYFDLSNDRWQAVRISKNGWEVIDNPPPLFKRYAHQKEAILPKADRNEDPTDVLYNIFELVNYDPD